MTDPKDEVKYRYGFIKHLFQLYISWFTFFGVLNITAIGWTASGDHKTAIPKLNLLILVAVVFLISNVLGLAASYYVYREIKLIQKRLCSLILPEEVSTPYKLYLATTVIIGLACCLYFTTWVILPFAV